MNYIPEFISITASSTPQLFSITTKIPALNRCRIPRSRVIFDDYQKLRQIYSKPVDVTHEPLANFPLGYYEEFLKRLREMDVEIITYKDLFARCNDWDYKRFYIDEYEAWNKRYRKSKKIYLLIQHDIDNYPEFTRRMVALEALYGVKSNIFMFRDRYTKDNADSSYIVDHEFFKQAEHNGYVIGYHQNAFALANFNMEAAVERYRTDVNYLRKFYNIEFVVPHGGVGKVIDGEKLHNVDVPMPEEFRLNLRWVFNRYGVKFSKKWSDGGLGKTRDPERIKSFDIVNEFLPKLERGYRYFCLIHPQRWGFNINRESNPLLAEEKWYRDICDSYL